MRILASNPDTLGDLVLRQPLYRALTDAGHELLLVVRQGVTPLVPYVAPGATTLVVPYETYANDIEQHWDLFGGVFEAARAFQPDVLLVAPYRWTAFEEKLAEELPPGARKVAMNGHLYTGDPHAGAAPVSRLRLDAVAEVCPDQLEVEKNAALCAAVLEQRPASIDPQLAASQADLDAGRAILQRLGLEPGGYSIACVGGTAHVAIKTWHAESWGRVLGEWAKRYGRRFLFVGLPEEESTAREVLWAMGEVLGSAEAVARHAAVWMEARASVSDLLALTQLSAGYVGHDTGPMHVAAAMGKPVLAVYGGGTWPRFRPAVTPSVALLVGVPCVGCGWVCPFEQPYCIKSVPADEVLRAAADLEEGRVAGREARVLEPDEALQRRMIREGADLARAQVRERAELSKRLQVSHQHHEADVTALHAARAREASERAAEAEQLHGELRRVHDEAARAAEAFAAHATETERLRQELVQRSAEAQRLTATLDERTSEVGRLRDEIRGMVKLAERAGGNGIYSAADTDRSAPARDEIAQLRAAIERLERRVGALEPAAAAPRRPLRQVLTDLVIGSRRYARRPGPHLPNVTVVTPVAGAADAGAVRATVESVLAQNYHALEFILVLAASDSNSTRLAPDTLAEFEDRIDRVLVEPTGNVADAAAKGLAAAEGELLHVLHAGHVLEAGAVQRVAEYFARRRGVQAAYSEDALLLAGGWKFPAPPQPTADVDFLLRCRNAWRNGVFFRRRAYHALGPLKPELGAAAEWDLWVRLARRFELRRIGGHFRSVPLNGSNVESGRSELDWNRAHEAFNKTYGLPGRVRCKVIGLANRVFDALRRLAPSSATGDGPLLFPWRADDRPPPPRGAAPSLAPGQPVCPLTGRPPDRFLFSTPDTTGGDRADGLTEPRAIHYVYYDAASGMALASPSVALERLNDSYATRHAAGAAAAVVAPPPGVASPYAGYRGGLLGRLGVADLLLRVPTPYWRLRKIDFGDPTADEVLRLLRGFVDPGDDSIRFLNVGCFEGAVLDRLRSETRWQTFGAETNLTAAAAARAKGHTVWEVAPLDAPLVLPVGRALDVVFLGHMTEHLQDPLLVLRRLRQLLTPGGLIVLDTPNLDSALARLFGPTWGHWQLPYHRTLLGRRALARLALLADMKLVRRRTRTHPYPACVSVQLNALGLAAIVPDTARFPDAVAARGVRLAGWARLLWDWRGKGDYLYAVLRAV